MSDRTRRLLLRLADLLEGNAPEFARRGTLDNGTPIVVSGLFVPTSAEWTRYYTGWAGKISSTSGCWARSPSRCDKPGKTLAFGSCS